MEHARVEQCVDKRMIVVSAKQKPTNAPATNNFFNNPIQKPSSLDICCSGSELVALIPRTGSRSHIFERNRHIERALGGGDKNIDSVTRNAFGRAHKLFESAPPCKRTKHLARRMEALRRLNLAVERLHSSIKQLQKKSRGTFRIFLIDHEVVEIQICGRIGPHFDPDVFTAGPNLA